MRPEKEIGFVDTIGAVGFGLGIVFGPAALSYVVGLAGTSWLFEYWIRSVSQTFSSARLLNLPVTAEMLASQHALNSALFIPPAVLAGIVFLVGNGILVGTLIENSMKPKNPEQSNQIGR